MIPLHVVLYQPEIPSNTGNIIRLCANTQVSLHLIEPIGFELDDKKLRRAGLDYHEWATIHRYNQLNDFEQANPNAQLIACSTKGRQRYDQFDYTKPYETALLFGPETRGLPQDIIDNNSSVYCPMVPNSRSLNLSNCVAVILFEALRRHNHPHAP